MEELKKYGTEVIAVKGWPDHVVVMGGKIAINVGGPSPQWVCDLADQNPTELRRRLAWIAMKASAEDLAKKCNQLAEHSLAVSRASVKEAETLRLLAEPLGVRKCQG